MKDLVKEFIELFKDNPKEMLKDSAAVFLIFTFSYLLLVLSSIQISKRTYERPCKHKICIYEMKKKIIISIIVLSLAIYLLCKYSFEIGFTIGWYL